MPDQDRQSSILSQGPDDGARCAICPGQIGVTFQADCVCCGRQVVAASPTALPDPKADLADSVKALSIKSEEVPQHAIPRPSHAHCCSSSHPGYMSLQPVVEPLQLGECVTEASVCRLGGGSGDGGGSGEAVARRAAGRMCQRVQNIVRPIPPRRGLARGRAGRGGFGGAHTNAFACPHFKGVRTRKGVRGFLVEIRPPKWKKTIWLGTYNTSIEAAGAYDAGVFYTKKANTKLNFRASVGAFPPLPSHLRLDRADNMDEIKLFVQNQAREAARRMGTLTTTSTTSQPTHHHHEPPPPLLPVAEVTTSSESCISVNEEGLPENAFQIPMDYEYLGQCLQTETVEETAKNMFQDYKEYVSQQLFSDDQEFRTS